MGCGSCSSGGGCTPAGCKSNGSCLTNGCSKLDVYDWLAHMDMPSNYKPFNIVEVKFKGSRKDFYINHENLYVENGELVVVETPTGGYDVGHISLTGELVRMQIKKKHLKMEDIVKKILRKATPADVDKWKAAKDLEWETMHKARTLALNLGLSMKLSDVDYQGDKTKATFYYTAEGRVDFRELIKKMAESFRIRIEMRQIGMRQEASRLGGIGSCGRELCCSTWLTDFKTVSTSAARYQNLSLNTLKLAGQCGKLKCCLNYELDTYMDALKDIPDDVDRLETEKGWARLQKTDIFKKLMWFSYPNEESWIPLEIDRVREIQQMNREGVKPEDLKDEAVELAPAQVAKILDYENVVGQDSITRLDEKTNKRKKKRNNKNKPKAEAAVPVKEVNAPVKDGRPRPAGNPPRQNQEKQQVNGTNSNNQQQNNRKPGGNRNHQRRHKNNNKPKANEE
ncbi:regulatory iron-sulfur-containing complex subunit RicT [Pedobacter sp. SYSU D00535]|uniref:PSP1 domain-containing protein n=1 Tax=Pedobacter sp. SYSU D00535 TaxID=2810308 RepID=UPI001A96AC7B|nr:regulatory iron-sulfur-containing complex subunit RicT [Pedobacter sp. SYSU D00535]